MRSYQAYLGQVASYLSQLGIVTNDPARLASFAIELANNFLAGPDLTAAEDISFPSLGLGLTFDRSYLQPISGRYRLGPLGRGWASNWEISVVTDPLGNAEIEEGGSVRTFTLQSDGSYRGQPGDEATLTLQNGIYQLREVHGDLLVFRADGKLDYVQDPNGNRITAAYDANGNLTSLTHSDGDSLSKERPTSIGERPMCRRADKGA